MRRQIVPTGDFFLGVIFTGFLIFFSFTTKALWVFPLCQKLRLPNSSWLIAPRLPWGYFFEVLCFPKINIKNELQNERSSRKKQPLHVSGNLKVFVFHEFSPLFLGFTPYTPKKRSKEEKIKKSEGNKEE